MVVYPYVVWNIYTPPYVLLQFFRCVRVWFLVSHKQEQEVEISEACRQQTANNNSKSEVVVQVFLWPLCFIIRSGVLLEESTSFSPVFEIISLKGTRLIRFITSQPPPPVFTWRLKQNPPSKRCNFSLLARFYIGRWKKSKSKIILNINHRQNPLASTHFMSLYPFSVEIIDKRECYIPVRINLSVK